jgi:hypothetical protein
MICLRPNRYYRIYRSDKSLLDFRTNTDVPETKHLIEVETKERKSVRLFELLAEEHWIDVKEIDKSVADL